MFDLVRVPHRAYTYGPWDGTYETVEPDLTCEQASRRASDENALNRTTRRDGFLYLYQPQAGKP